MDAQDVIENWSDIEEESEESDLSECEESENESEEEADEIDDTGRETWKEVAGKV